MDPVDTQNDATPAAPVAVLENAQGVSAQTPLLSVDPNEAAAPTPPTLGQTLAQLDAANAQLAENKKLMDAMRLRLNELGADRGPGDPAAAPSTEQVPADAGAVGVNFRAVVEAIAATTVCGCNGMHDDFHMPVCGKALARRALGLVS